MKKIVSFVLMLILLFSSLLGVNFNSSAQSVIKASFNKTYSGTISNTNHDDTYSIVLPSSGCVKIEYRSNIGGNGQNLYFKDNQGRLDKSWIYFQRNETTKQAYLSHEFYLIKGTYFFTIEQDYESTGVGNYSIVFTFNSSNESFAETYSTDNDSIYNASRIQLNKKYLGQIAENEEVDIYVFNVSSNSGFKIAYNSNIDGNGQNLYLFDKEGITLDIRI